MKHLIASGLQFNYNGANIFISEDQLVKLL